MKEVLGKKSNIKLGNTIFPILICVFVLLSIIYKPDPAHDLFRYYDEAERMNLNQGFGAIISNYYAQNSDFLYFLAFYLVRLIGLPIQIVNGIFVFLFYYATSLLILDLSKWKGYVSKNEINLALTFAFCSTPFIFVFSISRNAAALAFLYLALHCLFNKKRFFLVVFTFLAIITHIGIALYIAIIAISIFVSWALHKMDVKKNIVLLAIIFGAFILYMLKDGLNLILQLSFFETFHYFAQYIDDTGLVSLSEASLGMITTVTLVWVVIIISILSLNTTLEYPYNFVLFVLPFLYVSFFISNMFVQRTLMFLVPFNGFLLLGTIGKHPIGIRTIITIFSVFLSCSILVAINRCFI